MQPYIRTHMGGGTSAGASAADKTIFFLYLRSLFASPFHSVPVLSINFVEFQITTRVAKLALFILGFLGLQSRYNRERLVGIGVGMI